jgi:hypothetical protein
VKNLRACSLVESMHASNMLTRSAWLTREP